MQVDGYSLVRQDRVDRIGGGVCAFIQSHIPFKVLPDLQDDGLETLWLHLRRYKLPRGYSGLIICVVYHLPQSDNNVIVEHLTTQLDLALW